MLSKELDELTPKAKDMIVLLANRTIRKMRHTNQADKEDCLQTGILIMLTNWRHFDSNIGKNAFAYFTEIFKRGMAKGYNDIYKLKGDNNNNIKTISIQSSNDGDGLFNI